MAKYICLTISFSFLIFLVGCSSTGLQPVSPQISPQDEQTEFSENTFMPIIVSDYDESGTPMGGVGIMGMFSGVLDPLNMSAEITPVRNTLSALNDSLVVDITNFLTVSPCRDCVKMGAVSITSDGYPAVEFGVKHPFAPGNPNEPPSSINRLDLHVFSARGFVISDGVIGGGYKNFPSLAEKIPAWRLVNASGYASEFDSNWDSVLTTSSTLHPFILHFDDYSLGNFAVGAESGFTNVAVPTGNTIMAMGSVYNYKDYVFKFPFGEGQKLHFIYALTVSYGISSQGKGEWLLPRYRVPQYCQKSATYVKVTGIDNNLDDVNETSYADLTISILDINHGVAVGEEIDKMDFDSSVIRIDVEVPEMSNDPFTVTDIPAAYIGGSSRNPLDPMRFGIRIQNLNLAPQGIHYGLVKITDSYPSDANQHINGNAIPAVHPEATPSDFAFTVEEWATYSVFEYYVKLGNRRPNCELALEFDMILGGASLEAQPGPGTNDPDGSIILYEYDMDYDGITFNTNASNTTGNPVTLGPYQNDTGEDYTVSVAMRVTDNGTPPASTICTRELEVQYFTPILFFDDFVNNQNGWTFDTGEFWDIDNGFLGSSAGLGAQALGPGCYCGPDSGDYKTATSGYIQIDPIPNGYSKLKVFVHHALRTEIFPYNPYDFTDDCDLWVVPASGTPYKLITSGGFLYTTNAATSKDGPSFAGTIGIIPDNGSGFVGLQSEFSDSRLPGNSVKFQFRQNADDGIENCLGGWWIDWIKIEYIP